MSAVATHNVSMNAKETITVQPSHPPHLGRALAALIAALALLGAFAYSIAVPARASAAIEWEATMTSSAPTNLPPGGRGTFTIRLSNTGDTDATLWPTVALELPEGVTFDTSDMAGSPYSCAGVGDPQVVTCEFPFGDFFPPTVAYTHLGAFTTTDPAYVKFTVNIAADAPQGAHQVPITVSGGGAAGSSEHVEEVFIDDEQLGFGAIPNSFEAGSVDAGGQDDTQAGGHPYKSVTGFDLTTRFVEPPTNGDLWENTDLPTGFLKDVIVDLPAGFAGDPTAVPQCASTAVVADFDCPVATQVGIVRYGQRNAVAQETTSLHNVVPEKNAPAQLAFASPAGPVLLTPVLRSDGDWGLSVNTKNISEAGAIYYVSAEVWGVPADPSHDPQRCAIINANSGTCVGYDTMGQVAGAFTPDDLEPHSSPVPRKPFLTNPTRCDGQPVTSTLHLAEWENPASFEPDGDPDLSDPAWASSTADAPPLTGCENLSFVPSIDVEPTSSAPGAPSGLEFELSLPQSDNPDGLATAHLKDAVVALPAGVTVNPSSAGGLGACSSTQIGLVSKSPVRFDKKVPACPMSSKIGTVRVATPLLEDPLHGDVFLAAQKDNPFDSLLAIYMVVRGPGILGKLAGHVVADPQTGQLTTTVLSNPQVPFDTLTVSLKSGPRAPLALPSECGTYSVTADLSSWAGHEVQASDSFTVACPGTANLFDPGFSAGSVSPVAGSFSPFLTRFTRDGGKELGRIDVKMPKGLLAKLRDVDVCSDAQLASAAGKSGRTTQSSPACPAGSQVGTTTTGAGAGSHLFFPTIPGSNVSGRVFLTGPHTATQFPVPGGLQADYGLAIEVPAVAGPFDLGTVLVRAAIYVDPETAELTVVSDRLPRILEGLPLNVRDVRVNIDREGFAINPTSCAEKAIGADIRAQDGTLASRSSRFQVGDCASLALTPRVSMRLVGRKQTRTGDNPALRVRLRQPSGAQSNIANVKATLPLSLALDAKNAAGDWLCEFEAGQKADCPASSRIGSATAYSPLLKRPVTGPVFFVKNVRTDPRTGAKIRTLPTLLLKLDGEAQIRLRATSSVKGGRLVSTFAGLPDAKVSRFDMRIRGGDKRGVLAVTGEGTDLCRGSHVTRIAYRGQNGRAQRQSVRIKTPCAKAAKKKQGKRPAATGRRAR